MLLAQALHQLLHQPLLLLPAPLAPELGASLRLDHQLKRQLAQGIASPSAQRDELLSADVQRFSPVMLLLQEPLQQWQQHLLIGLDVGWCQFQQARSRSLAAVDTAHVCSSPGCSSQAPSPLRVKSITASMRLQRDAGILRRSQRCTACRYSWACSQ